MIDYLIAAYLVATKLRIRVFRTYQTPSILVLVTSTDSKVDTTPALAFPEIQPAPGFASMIVNLVEWLAWEFCI